MADDFGDRMKQYEMVFDQVLPRRIPMVIRIDGKNFHTMVKKWKCIKPFDSRLQRHMSYTATELCKSIEGAKIAYIQSDEISIVVYDDNDKMTQPWFGKRLNKILSISSAIATRAFNSYPFFDKSNVTYGNTNDVGYINTMLFPAIFDSRAFVLPEYDVTNNLIWRQQDATRNSVQMLARSLYSHKELQNLKNPELQDYCFKKGHNWNDILSWQKRGWCIIKKQTEIQTENGSAIRNKWIEDLEIPVFTKNRRYIEEKLRD